MKRRPLLLLVDLQEDFLAQLGLEPSRGAVVSGAAHLLEAARARGMPVFFLQTTVRRAPDDRMPHWRAQGRWACVEGEPGHAMPKPLQPQPGETIFHKTGFSALLDPGFLPTLREAGFDSAIVAGIHLHACVRQAVLDLHQLGLATWVASDATGSHEPFHAAQTELYLRARGVRFAAHREILAWLDGEAETAPAEPIDPAVRAAQSPPAALEARIKVLRAAADRLQQEAPALAAQITAEIGKPIHYSRGEVARAAALLRAVAQRISAEPAEEQTPEGWARRRSLGKIALITPWNNPLAIAAGQWAPAFAHGNSVLWKPALSGLSVARSFHRLLSRAGLPPSALQLIAGGEETGLALIAHPEIDAVCFTGSTARGRKVAALCASRSVPLQAELGGNNATVVFSDAPDREQIAQLIVEAAFGCSGQRCTATRRVILTEDIRSEMVANLTQGTRFLAWGDPACEATRAGPLLDREHVARVAGCVQRAREEGCTILQPHPVAPPPEKGAFYPPTLVLCDRPESEIVQEETFGPVLVIQRARDREHAFELLNGVRQGLAASLFSSDPEWQDRFLAEARAGLLKVNRTTVEAGVDLPFGGWKESGLGPPQHGAGNREFFTRAQAIYRS